MKWFERPVIKHIEHIGILLAVCAVLFDIYWRFAVDRPIARDERIERAWETVARRIPGESGKRLAIEILREVGVPLTGIDLSCEAMGGGWSDNDQSCNRRTWLEEVDFSGTMVARANLKYSDFSGTNLNKAKLAHADLWRSDFSGAWLFETDFTGADLRRATLEGANLSGAIFTNTRNLFVNISSATFCDVVFGCAVGLEEVNFGNMWFWDDKPPIVATGTKTLDLKGSIVHVCPSARRTTQPKEGRNEKPTGCEIMDAAEVLQ